MKLRYTAELTNGILLRELPVRMSDALMDSMTFKNPVWLSTKKHSAYDRVSPKIPEFLELASLDEFNDTLWLPRGYCPELFGVSAQFRNQMNRLHLIDRRVCPPGEFPAPVWELNTEQKLLFSQLEQSEGWKRWGRSLVVSPTGTGKTFFLAEQARKLNTPALILCLTTQIMETWWNDLKSAYGLSRPEIGHIQGKKFVTTRHFTLAMVATLGRNPGLWPEIHKHFGTIIVDECDTLGHPAQYNFCKSSPARYMLGATATPDSSNFWTSSMLGPPLARVEQSDKASATSLPLSEIRVVRTRFEFPMSQGAVDFHKLTEALTEDTERNDLIIDNVVNDWRSGHSVLVACRRVVHCHELFHRLQDAGIEDINMITGETNAKKQHTRQLVHHIKERNITCVVATYQSIKRGANLNPLDRLHVTAPIPNSRDIEQLVGRVRRKAIGKVSCKMVYYLDPKVSYLQGVFNRHVMQAALTLKVKHIVS